MEEVTRTRDGLRMMQAAPLSVKIRMTMSRIADWVNEYGEEGVYISFSGGKDSTVLLDIIRNRCGYKRIPAVFVDVPTQYPELKAFVKTFDNVEIIRPKMGFTQVCEKYGFPLISKEVAGKVYEAMQKKDGYAWKVLHGSKKKGSKFDISKWCFMLEAPFKIHSYCCNALKKNPIKKYEHDTQRFGITATMAEESKVRTSQWLKNGCNGFNKKRPISNPMSFWTENDILTYIHDYRDDLIKWRKEEYQAVLGMELDAKIVVTVNKMPRLVTVRELIDETITSPICSVYGDVVEDYGEQVDGQMDLSDYGLAEPEKKYKTTGCDRTGCMLCGFGCHLDKPGEGRFERLKQTHPKMYQMLDLLENNGVTFREAIDWLNEHGNLHIRY